MRPHLCRSAAVLACLLLAPRAVADAPRTLADLRRMSPCELEALFRQAEPGAPPAGVAAGRLLYSTDPRHPRPAACLSNALWKGKVATADGYFINRWLGGIRAIDSHYALGPSWVDGRPAYVMEYAPGTPVFANSRDELREVAPGLYLGPLYDRCPRPKLRGYLGVQFHAPADGCGCAP